MNNRDCFPCSAEPNQYEDDWRCSLIEWLDNVTCIGWIQAFPDSSRPDDEEAPTGQYGTIHVDSIKYSPSKKTEDIATTGSETCVRITSKVDVDVTLRVYNHAHMPSQNGQKKRTSGDVLLRVLDAYSGIHRLATKLKNEGVSVSDFGQINNTEELVSSSYQRRSSLSITLCISRATSFADDVISGFTLDTDCAKSTKPCN